MKHGLPGSVGGVGAMEKKRRREKRAVSCALTGLSGSDVTGRTVLVLSLGQKERKIHHPHYTDGEMRQRKMKGLWPIHPTGKQRPGWPSPSLYASVPRPWLSTHLAPV